MNASHLDALRAQRRAGGGFIVANPNCSTIGLALALKPLWDRFGVSQVQVATMQAISGAGLDGVSAGVISDNVLPHIPGEEEKLETEPRKIFGRWEGAFWPAELVVSAACHRVAVLDGHLEAVSVKLRSAATADEVVQAFESFRVAPEVAALPSSPPFPVQLHRRPDRPQPRLDRDAGRGMTVAVGRVRECPVLD